MDQAQSSPEAQILALLETEQPEQERVEQQAPETQQEPQQEAQPETEAAVEIDPDAKFIEVEVKEEGGETRTEKLSLNELKAQRMMQADYQRKTQELARQREEVPLKIRQGIQEHLTQSVQQLQVLHGLVSQTVAQELANVDLNKLAVEDPAEYVRVSNRARQLAEAKQAVEGQIAQRSYQLSEMQKQNLQRMRDEATVKIKSEIPNYDEIAPALRETGKAYGFTPEQIESVVHPGFAKLLHDAHEFRKSKDASKTLVDKKVATVPKVLKPGTVREDAGRERVTESMKKLQKTHRVEDAAAAIFHMLK